MKQNFCSRNPAFNPLHYFTWCHLIVNLNGARNGQVFTNLHPYKATFSDQSHFFSWQIAGIRSKMAGKKAPKGVKPRKMTDSSDEEGKWTSNAWIPYRMFFSCKSIMLFGTNYEWNGIDIVGRCYHISWSCFYSCLQLKNSCMCGKIMSCASCCTCYFVAGVVSEGHHFVAEFPRCCLESTEIRSDNLIFDPKLLTKSFSLHILLLPLFPQRSIPWRATTRPFLQWIWGVPREFFFPRAQRQVVKQWRISFKAPFQTSFPEWRPSTPKITPNWTRIRGP